MTIHNKPSGDIFAQDAKSGELVTFPDIKRGWGLTIEQTAKKPPLSWMNGLMKQMFENLEYIRQNGIAPYDNDLEYPKGALTYLNDSWYLAVKNTKGNNPENSTANWKKVLDSKGVVDASLTTKGIVKLNNSTNSESETEAATPNAVKVAYDLANGKPSKQYVDDKFNGIDLSGMVAKDSFIGVPIPHPTNYPPEGYIVMVGQSISQSQYPKLFAMYGSKLPDMRDRYIRGANGSRGGVPLTLQDDAIRNITGMLVSVNDKNNTNGAFSYFADYNGSIFNTGNNNNSVTSFNASRVVPTANENRPISITFNYICLAG